MVLLYFFLHILFSFFFVEIQFANIELSKIKVPKTKQ